LLQPGRFTELFFLDEATALAAGHRPCALCRREDYNRFLALWRTVHRGAAGADAVDEQLHVERIDGSWRRFHEAHLDDLPDAAFVLHCGDPHLVFGGRLLRWSAGGYTHGSARPSRHVRVITPPSLVAVLRCGWSPSVPLIHPSARRPAARATPQP
jgi:hypothetical protein